MTVNERLETLERSKGRADHDLLMKLDAMSRQIAHFEKLLKDFEDANFNRYKDLANYQSKLADLIAELPREFSGTLQLPLGSLPIMLGPGEVRHYGRTPNVPATAVHEKPHP